MSEQDIPLLVRMLSDRDHVTQMAAANVLADMNDDGPRALQQALTTAADVRSRSVIEDALRQSASPGRRPIRDYPLTEQERAHIRGCRSPG